MINAIVAVPTTSIEIMDITLMKFLFFLERKYLRAMKKGRFNLYQVLVECLGCQ